MILLLDGIRLEEFRVAGMMMLYHHATIIVKASRREGRGRAGAPLAGRHLGCEVREVNRGALGARGGAGEGGCRLGGGGTVNGVVPTAFVGTGMQQGWCRGDEGGGVKIG